MSTTPAAPRTSAGAYPDAAMLAVLALLTAAAVPVLTGPSDLAAVSALLAVAAATPSLVRVDLAEHRLPNAIVLAAAVPVLGALALAAVEAPVRAAGAVLGGLAYGALLLALNVLGGMGMGDVKLGAVLGAAAGLLGLPVAVAAVVAAFLTGGVVSALLLATRRAGRADALPFGPFLLLGFWLAVAVG